MDFILIVILVIFIVCAVLAFKLIKSIIKAAFSVATLLILIIAIFGFFIYLDAIDIKENLGNSDKLLLLEADNVIVAGVKTFADDREAEFIKNQEELPIYPPTKSEEFYKIITIKLETLINGSAAMELEADEHNISKIEAERILRSENAKEEAISIVTAKEGAENGDNIRKEWEGKTDVEIKGMVFGALFKQLTEEKGSEFEAYLLKEYKKGNVKISPETALFKAIKILPAFLLDKIKI